MMSPVHPHHFGQMDKICNKIRFKGNGTNRSDKDGQEWSRMDKNGQE